jgi:hypothetical protein
MSIPNKNAYLEMSDFDLSYHFDMLKQDFLSNAQFFMIERERRLKNKINNLKIQTKNTVWDTNVISPKQKTLENAKYMKNVASFTGFEVSEMKKYDFDEWSEMLNIDHDKEGEKDDKYIFDFDKKIKMKRILGNKNWVYSKKQKKIKNSLRSKKKTKFNQKEKSNQLSSQEAINT